MTPNRLQRVSTLALIWLFPLYPLIPRFSLAGPLGTDDLIPVLCIGLAAAALLTDRPKTLGEHRQILLLLALVAVTCSLAGFLLADGLTAHITALLRAGARLVFYGILLTAVSRLDATQRQKLATMLACVVVFEAVFGLVCYAAKLQGPWQTGMLAYPPDAIPESGRIRVQGTFGGEVPAGYPFLNRANFYSAYMAVGLAALGPFLLQRRRMLLAGAGVVLVLGGILVSYSRMSLLAALAGLAVLGALDRRFTRVVVPLLLVAGLGVLFSPALRDRFSDLGNDRSRQWHIALRVIAEHPLLGAGDGRYIDVATPLAAGIDVPRVQTPHNSVLYAAASYGIPAGLALVALYVGFLVATFRRYRQHKDPAPVALVVTFLVHDLTNNLFFIPEVALCFWALYGALGSERAGEPAIRPGDQLRRP